MGRVVRAADVRVRAYPQRHTDDVTMRTYALTNRHNVHARITARGHSIEQVEADLAVVRETLGSNISDALKTALHLTARAFREGRLP